MDAIRSSVEAAFGKAMGQAVSGLLVWTMLLVFITVFLLTLYFFTRGKGAAFNIKFGRGEGLDTNPTQTASAVSGSMAPPQDNGLLGHYATPPEPDSDRKAFLQSLDSAEHVFATIYIALLWFVLVAATAAMAWIYFKYPDDGNRDFMLFYGGVIYLIGVLGLTLQISKTKQRLRGRSGPGLIDQLRSKIEINFQTAPETHVIDAAALDRARRHVAGGGTLDEACALVDPRYAHMSGWSKYAFRKAVEMSLEKQGLNSG